MVSKFLYRLFMAILLCIAVLNIINGQSVAQNKENKANKPVAGIVPLTSAVKESDRLFFSYLEETEMPNTKLGSRLEFYVNTITGKPQVSISMETEPGSWEEQRYGYTKQTFRVNPAQSNFNVFGADKVDVFYISSWQQLKVFSKENVPVCAVFNKDLEFIGFSNDVVGMNMRATNNRASNDGR